MHLARRRFLLDASRLAAWYAVFDLCGIAAGISYGHQAEAYNQIYLDPTVAPRDDGRIEAPVIKFSEAVEKFA